MTYYIQRRSAIFRDEISAVPNCGVAFSWAWHLNSNRADAETSESSHQVLEPIRRPLVVGHLVDRLQAIESSSRCENLCSYRCTFGSSAAIESSSPRVAAKASSGRGTSSRRTIGSSASHWVIEASSCCRGVSGIEISSRYRSCDQLRVMDCRRVVVPISSSSYHPNASDPCQRPCPSLARQSPSLISLNVGCSPRHRGDYQLRP